MTPGPIPGRKLLTRVIARVWEAGQHAPSQEVFELTSIILQLLGQTLDRLSTQWKSDLGVLPSSRMLDLACYQAHGMKFSEWGRRNELRKSALAWELSRCVPDYDPAQERSALARSQVSTMTPIHARAAKRISTG
jgi:hypothetical protein